MYTLFIDNLFLFPSLHLPFILSSLPPSLSLNQDLLTLPCCRKSPLTLRMKADGLSPQVPYPCNGSPDIPPASLHITLHTAAQSSFLETGSGIIKQTPSQAITAYCENCKLLCQLTFLTLWI